MFSFGQQTLQDVVYLKNGGILRGTIIEKFPDQSIKFENSDVYRTIFIFKKDVIEKLTREAVVNVPPSNTNYGGNSSDNNSVQPSNNNYNYQPSNNKYQDQQSVYDVVYLKNGGILRGTIIEKFTDQSIKFENSDSRRTVFIFENGVIEKLTKEAVSNVSSPNTNYNGNSLNSNNVQPSNNNYNPSNDNYNYQQSNNLNQASNRKHKLTSNNGPEIKSGFFSLSECGYGLGIGPHRLNYFNVHAIVGYKFNPYISFGFLGLGLRFYYPVRELSVPLFTYGLVHFIDGNISPYLGIGIGYSFIVSPAFSIMGFLLNPSVGCSFKLRGKIVLNVGSGYFIQRSGSLNFGSINFVFGVVYYCLLYTSDAADE